MNWFAGMKYYILLRVQGLQLHMHTRLTVVLMAQKIWP